MKNYEITDTINEFIKANFTSHRIKWGVGTVFKDGNLPYIEPFVIPNFNEEHIGGHKKIGIISINLWYPAKEGNYYGQKELQPLADLFEDGTEIAHPDINIEGVVVISSRPHIGVFVDNKNGWWFNPLTIDYYNKECLDNG